MILSIRCSSTPFILESFANQIPACWGAAKLTEMARDEDVDHRVRATLPADRLRVTQSESPCLPASLEHDLPHASCLGGTQEAPSLLAQAALRTGSPHAVS